MAIDPVTAQKIAGLIISKLTDEEKRQRLIIGIVVGIVTFLLILAIPMLLLTSKWEKIKDFFGWNNEEEMQTSSEYAIIYQMKQDYWIDLESDELVFQGELPMPVNNAVVTSEFGNRIHPITRKEKFSYRNRFSWNLAQQYNICFRWTSRIFRSIKWIWKLC